MNSYLEQTVSADLSGKKRAAYGLIWAAVLLLLAGSLVSAAGIIGVEGISWIMAAVTLALLGGAFALFRLKDRLRMEYDYAIRDGRISVAAVMNGRRRRERLDLEIGRISRCGRGKPAARPGVKQENFCLNKAAESVYICYENQSEKRMALLELNEDMIAALRGSRALQRGAWSDAEGKSE